LIDCSFETAPDSAAGEELLALLTNEC
jgi:hypothetical protein